MAASTAKTKRKFLAVTAVAAALLFFATGCGKGPVSARDQRYQLNGIIGGQKATGEEEFAKTVVALYDERFRGTCTASIISDSLLVTAAHCLMSPAANLRVIFGTDLNTESRVTRDVVSYETTPLWPDRKYQPKNTGDMAIVRFSGGLPPGFQPAAILTDATLLAADTSVLLAGYGIDDAAQKTGAGVLRYVETKIADPAYSETEMTVDQTTGKGACRGDSGGPAYVLVGKQWMLWGVTNGGVNDSKNNCTGQGLYASIPAYKNWIAETAQKMTGTPLAAN